MLFMGMDLRRILIMSFHGFAMMRYYTTMIHTYPKEALNRLSIPVCKDKKI